MKRPPEISLSRAEGEALIERLETGAWTPEDRQVLAQVVRLYFWLLFMLQESKLTLKRFRAMIFGNPAKPRKSRSLDTRAQEVGELSPDEAVPGQPPVETSQPALVGVSDESVLSPS